MYFLSHTFILLDILPKEVIVKKKFREPLLAGVWAPDAGYFPHFSWQLKRFTHSSMPSINPFSNEYSKEAFRIGWMVHILCDELIHNQPFFSNFQPFCPPIPNGKNPWLFFQAAKRHLGREVGLDLFLLERLSLEKSFLYEILMAPHTYLSPNVDYPGFKSVQKYLAFYITSFLPALASETIFGRKIRSLINYELFYKPKAKEKILQLLKKAKNSCEKIVKSFLHHKNKKKLFNETENKN